MNAAHSSTDHQPATTSPATEHETLSTAIYEFCDWQGSAPRIDRQQGVLRGVKILGVRSQNGRVYLPEALAAAAGLYEGAKVNVNHPKGHPRAPRDYQERIGTLRGVAVRADDGLYGDFHFNPRHALAEQLLWDASHAPQNVGFSHNVEAKLARRDQQWTVEAITRVVSVDLVADPATTAGLFEAAASDALGAAGTALEPVSSPEPQLPVSLVEENAALRNELVQLRQQADELRAAADMSQRRSLAAALLAEHRLPPPHSSDPTARAITSDAFFATLLSAPNEEAIRQLVVERAELVEAARGAVASANRPVSRPPRGVDPQPPALDTLSFVRAVRG